MYKKPKDFKISPLIKIFKTSPLPSPNLSSKHSILKIMPSKIIMINTVHNISSYAAFSSGLEKYKIGKKDETLPDFYQVLALTPDEDLENLTSKQKSIVANTHAHIADIIKHKSLECEEKALEHARKSLEIDPNLALAKHIKTLILTERGKLTTPVDLHKHSLK